MLPLLPSNGFLPARLKPRPFKTALLRGAEAPLCHGGSRFLLAEAGSGGHAEENRFLALLAALERLGMTSLEVGIARLERVRAIIFAQP